MPSKPKRSLSSGIKGVCFCSVLFSADYSAFSQRGLLTNCFPGAFVRNFIVI